MSRLSRKQIKRDEMAETVGSVVDYSRRHSRGILWGVVALIALVVVGAAFLFWWQRQGLRASELVAEAMKLQAEEGAEAAARPLLEQVLERYPRSHAANTARLYLGSFAAGEGDVERARELWLATLSRSAGTAFGMQAQLNLWTLGRQQGRYEEVTAEIRAQLDSGEAELPADQLLYELAVTLEGDGRQGEAREVYERLVEEHPLSALRELARQRVDQLGPATGLG